MSAMERIEQFTFDSIEFTEHDERVILVDVDMYAMNGRGFAEQLRDILTWHKLRHVEIRRLVTQLQNASTK